MLKQRIIFGTILASIVLYGIFYANLKIYYALIGIFSLISLFECFLMMHKENKVALLSYWIVSIILSALAIFYSNDGTILCFSAAAIWLVAFISILFYPGISSKIWGSHIVTGGFFIITISAFAYSLIEYKHDPNLGNKYIFYVLLLCWGTDIGAYFSGKKFGHRKMAPNISPNKTIEGLLGGVLSAFIIILLFNLYFEALSITNILVGIAVCFCAVFGDLFESMIKRIFSVKDSSKIIPGHGGVLDRIDSVIPAITLFYTLSALLA